MNLTTRWFLLSSVLFFITGCREIKYDLIIRNAQVADGTGAPLQNVDVAVRADTLAAIGDLGSAVADSVVDAAGLVLAPGFIDVHSHHDGGLDEGRDALAMVSQGITTIIVGQDGGSDIPLSSYFGKLEQNPVAVNVASYSGHNSIRDNILGQDFKRKATDAEVEKMKALLQADLEAGALGLSTGLEYDPGIYSAQEEVLTLARMLPAFGGRYISHLRSEDRYFHEAVEEIIRIGKETGVPVQISHFKLAMRGLWGQAGATLKRLDQARADGVDITADWYPYPYWSSTIRVLFPNRNFNDLKEAEFILRDVTTPEGILFSRYDPNPEFNGRTLADVAKEAEKSPAEMLIELIRRLDACREKQSCSGSIVATSMSTADMNALARWPHTCICSDGSSSGRHPRGFGTFTRVLGQYVRDSAVLTLPEAVHKMTGLSARQTGILRRGVITTGHYADLVLFDPKTVRDVSTTSDPQAVSEGIHAVWVNGRLVYRLGKTTGDFSGRVLRRSTR